MSQFDDAKELVAYCEARVDMLRAMHERCLAEKSVEADFLIEVKSFMEHLRSALDYCARGLFAKYGQSAELNVKVYFPYARHSVDKTEFRQKVVEGAIPGVSASRPDIVDILESYQHFGNSGNWLPCFMRIVNENKHEQLTPQVQKQYTAVTICAKIPAGETVKIDLKKLPLDDGSDKPIKTVVGAWTGLVFSGTGTPVMPLLKNTMQNVDRVVEELSVV